MKLREEFIQACVARNRPSILDLAELFGISEKCGHKWLNRYNEEGLPGLADRSRRPHTSPNETPKEVRDALIALRKTYPKWGPKKLVCLLSELHPEMRCPSPSTAGTILKAEGLVTPRRRTRRLTAADKLPFAPVAAPNDTWAIDHKGQFTVERRACYPLTITDLHARFLFACEPCTTTAHGPMLEVLIRVFREFGLPLRVRSDNGPPFGSQGIGGLSRLTVFLAHLLIEQEFITPGEPQENGEHERMHRTLQLEAVMPAGTKWPEQRQALHDFKYTFNHVRPHEALGMRTPAAVYVPSIRPFPSRLPELQYHTGFSVRRVRPTGEIKWRGKLVFLSETLAGEDVGLLDSDQDGWWTVHLGPWELGLLSADAILLKRKRARWVPVVAPNELPPEE